MEETKKRGILFKVVFIIVAVAYAAVIELSKNTLVGWLLAALVLTAFFLIRPFMMGKKWYVRLCSWIVLAVLLLTVFQLSYPPYKQVPAVSVRDPEVTDVVTVTEGDLTGVYNGDKSVEVYAGIPFAKPPVGELRWKETEAPEPWEGVRACDTFAPKSMQQENSTLWDTLVMAYIYNDIHLFNPRDNYREAMSEDSLYLNVWKPAGDISDAPVLVFIHGGSLKTGNSFYDQYNGEAYAKRGIVFVSITYRLNVFGYYANEELAAESPNGTTGNYGLLDQIQALKWVNENIAAFGGDASNITIAGESAGASSVNALCVSPLSKGLFRRAVAESSGIVAHEPYHTFRYMDDALAMGQDVMKEFRKNSVAQLREVPAEKLVKTNYSHDAMTVDGYAITEQPYLTYERGANHEEALLSGYNATEADVFTIMGTDVDAENYSGLIGKYFDGHTSEVVKLYPVDEKNAKAQYNDVMGGMWFAYSHYTWSRYMAREGRPVYEYYFTKANKGLSTNHAGELPYFYGNLDTMKQNYKDRDYELSDEIMGYIVNFCKNGDPNGAGLPGWPDFSQDETLVLELGEDVRMVTDPYLKLYAIIDEVQGYGK
ncbi:MAG: carboxylesterase family protein [Lachnospiraceae bacterium]|nr:carboxylesterase family protein [Lachnospiraceae bacterium]